MRIHGRMNNRALMMISGVMEYLLWSHTQTDSWHKPGVSHFYAPLRLSLIHIFVLHPWEETFAINDKKVYPFMEICREYGLPVLVETGYPWLSHCFQVADLAERFQMCIRDRYWITVKGRS